ncbi:MAG: ribosomal protein [Pseudomonadota bacterium]|jgi:large subunit ribosomal protein L1
MTKRLKKVAALLQDKQICSVEQVLALKNKYKDCSSKMDETFTISFKLNIDPKKTDQNVRGYVVMNSPIYKNPKVLVFTKNKIENNNENIIFASDTLDEIDIKARKMNSKNGAFKIGNFDFCVASQDMMSVLPKVAKLLGTKGLMPNTKYGTVAQNVSDILEKVSSGKYVKFTSSSDGTVYVPFSKLNSNDTDFVNNMKLAIEAVNLAKPAAVKGDYIKAVHISSTMGFVAKLDHKNI